MIALEETTARDGVVVADGYGVAIRVWRGRLEIDDGVGSHRRLRRFHRATSRLKRLIVLGSSGTVTLEALHWLSDVGAAFVQIARDGRVIASYGPPGTDRPSLRRAQAIASITDRGVDLGRDLIAAKLEAQLATLATFSARLSVDVGLAAIADQLELLKQARTLDELRMCEAWGAAAYWHAFGPLQVRFARRDAAHVPVHWRTFGGRGSPLANGPRVAANPANALLNLSYALLEAEASLAARTVGVDPGLGVLHADVPHRDSLACDLMEPIRPLVDAYVFELLLNQPFAARDFRESRTGACRVTAPLTHQLVATSRHWGELVGRVAEDFSAALEQPSRGPVPTPISGRRRAQGRPLGPAPTRKPSPAKAKACSWCGSPTPPGRQTCNSACADRVLGEIHKQFAVTSSERMRRFAGRPDHPGLTPEANRKRSETRRAQRAEELAWEREHPCPVDREWFAREVTPNLSSLSARAIARATGLSVGHCAKLKRGERVPHPMWWDALQRAATNDPR